MTDFERKFPTADDIAILRPRRMMAVTEYGPLLALLKRQTYGRYDADTIVCALLTFVGSDVTRRLINTNPTKVIEIAGLVLNDHVDQSGLGRKDLQVNLILNIVTALTREAQVGKTQAYLHAENILRTLELPAEIKLKLKQKLFDDSVLFSDKIWITRVQ